VKMAVGPEKGRLNNQMKIIEFHIRGNKQSAPNWWSYIFYVNSNLIDRT